MSNILKLSQIEQYEYLDKEYPGILRLSLKLDQIEIKQLLSLSELIKYNFPKAYYTDDILKIDQKIQQIYFDFIERGIDNFNQNTQQPAEIMRKCSQISDQQEAEVILQIQQQQKKRQQKYNAQQVQSFISQFDFSAQSQFVNAQLIRELSNFANIRKQKASLNNGQQKEKQLEKSQKKRKNSYKNKDQNDNKQKQKYKTEIIISIGDKISQQVKQMRNYIKKLSLESFAVKSIISEQQKSIIQKQKIEISLCLNKVAKQNIPDLFNDLKGLIQDKQQLAIFFVQQLLQKCLNQFRMIDTYLEFACLFTKISNNCFKWEWSDGKQRQQINHINHFHRILVQKMQDMFRKLIQQPEKVRDIKYLTLVIGKLIQRRKLSRRVYFQVNNQLIQRVCQQFWNQQKCKQVQQCMLQASVYLIEALGNYYNDIQHQFKIIDNLTKKNQSNIKTLNRDIVPNSMQEILKVLVQNANFQTLRIKCLIQNLFERNQKTSNYRQPAKQSTHIQQTQQKKSQVLKKQKIRQLLNQQNGMSQVVKLYQEFKSQSLLSVILLTFFDGKKSDVISHINTFIEQLDIPQQQFQAFWQNNYVNFAYLECDLPFMTNGLTILIKKYLGQNCMELINKNLQQDDDQDVTYFIKKLLKNMKQF